MQKSILSRISRRSLLTTLATPSLIASSGSRTSAASERPSSRYPKVALDAAESSTATPEVGAITPQLQVTPNQIRFDERFDVQVTRLRPGQEVTITSTFIDYSAPFTATATFVADTWGVVDLSAQQPTSGTWDVPDAMGLVWSAQGRASYRPPISAPERILISTVVDNVEVSDEIVTRTILPEDRAPRRINEDGIVADYYAHGTEDRVPAVIVVGGSDGGISPYTDLLASMLAAHGYATLALAYFNIGTLPTKLSQIPLEYFGDAIAWLQEQPGIDPERIGIVGVSRGGELALLLGSKYAEIKAVVSYVGSGYVYPEWAGSSSDPTVPAWTWEGMSVPHLSSFEPSEAELREAEIPVEQINGPVLLIGADDDRVWPSSYLSSIAWERLQREHHTWPDQFLRYPGAGHGISVPPYAPVEWMSVASLGGNAHSNATAIANCWPAVLQMLNTRLKYA